MYLFCFGAWSDTKSLPFIAKKHERINSKEHGRRGRNPLVHWCAPIRIRPHLMASQPLHRAARLLTLVCLEIDHDGHRAPNQQSHCRGQLLHRLRPISCGQWSGDLTSERCKWRTLACHWLVLPQIARNRLPWHRSRKGCCYSRENPSDSLSKAGILHVSITTATDNTKAGSTNSYVAGLAAASFSDILHAAEAETKTER